MCAILEKYEAAAREEGRKKGREEGLEAGQEIGTINTLKSLVTDNILTVKEAARRAGMTQKKFKQRCGLR